MGTLSKSSGVRVCVRVQDVEMDRERLNEKGKSGEFRCLRFATVRDNWPALLRAYEGKKAEAADKAAKKEARKYGPQLFFDLHGGLHSSMYPCTDHAL